MRFLELLCYVISMLVFLGLAEANLSDEEKEEIVRAHNLYRGKVDPIATNMEQMVICVQWSSYSLEFFNPMIIDP